MVTVIKNTPTVSVIIPSYNGKHLLKDCLSSLYELNYPSRSLDIKVVDNTSTDGTTQYVHRNFRKVQVLRNDENNFCKANNLGIKNSRAEMVAFLNNDTKVEKEWLKALVDSISTEEHIGCAGSKVLFPDGKIQSTGHYEFPNFRWGDRGLREPDIGQYETTEEVNSLCGASVLFRRSCLDDVGYFDEDFVMYLEDVDIFLRCRKKNWKLLYVPTSIVHHAFHGTADEKSVRFYIERNRLLLIAKHFPNELSRALESKEYSLRQEELYSILPDLFFKLLKQHTLDSLKPALKDFFSSLQKVYNLSKDQVVQELNNSLADARKQMSADMQNQKIQLEGEALKLKEKAENNYAQLEELKKVLLDKDTLLQKVSQARLSMETKVSQLTGVQDKFSKLQQEREKLNNELSLRSEELVKGQEFTNTLKVEVSALEHKIELMHLESTHREDKFTQLEQEREKLNNELSLRSEELEKEHQYVDNLRVEVSQLQQERENLSREIFSRSEELEKEHQSVDILRAEVGVLEQEIIRHNEQLSQATKQLQQLSGLVDQQQGKISSLIAELDAGAIKLSQAEDLNNLNKGKIETLMRQNQHQQEIIHEKENYIHSLLNSRTYRRLVIPLWRLADFVKVYLLGRRKEKLILVIKPYYVSAEETERALQDLHLSFSTTKITLFANVFKEDFNRLKANINTDELMLYSPEHIKLTKFRLFLAWVKFNIRYFDEAIVLVGAPVYHGYRKAKVMAWLASAKSARVYFVTSKAFAPLYTMGILSKVRILFESAFQSMAFMGVILFFIFFVVLPLKLKKIFEK